jgi:hypothetical protein
MKKFLQLQALNARDRLDSAWCYIEVDSIQALVPGFESKGTYVLSSSGVQTHVSESPGEIMAMIEKA